MKPTSARESRTPSLSRRALLRLAAAGPLALALPAALTGSPAAARHRESTDPLDRFAGLWRTWLIASPRQFLSLLPPPFPRRDRDELAELLGLQAQRSPAILSVVRFWDHQGGILAWSQILLDTIRTRGTNPVLASRALALFHAAMADASIASWLSKFSYERRPPFQVERRLASLSEVDARLPSYVSEHAAVAGAAAAVLEYLFPGGTVSIHGQTLTFDAAAREAGLSRLWAGASYRSDIEAGMLLGQKVGALAVARGQSDGSDAVWDPVTQPGRLTGPPYWVPTPPAFASPPLLPLAGTWRPWLLDSGQQFRQPVPPALEGGFPSQAFLDEVNEVYQVAKSPSPEQLQIALFWADNPGQSFTPPGHWAQIAAQQVADSGWSTPRAARALALVAAGLADSAISCWDNKYTYWVCRPVTAIRTLTGQPFSDPGFSTPIPTPPFPAYTSGHSTFSGCAAAVLEFLFPGGTVPDAFGSPVSFADAADQAALSRLYGGIHYRSDNERGLVGGRSIAGLVIQRAQSDGTRA